MKVFILAGLSFNKFSYILTFLIGSRPQYTRSQAQTAMIFSPILQSQHLITVLHMYSVPTTLHAAVSDIFGAFN